MPKNPKYLCLHRELPQAQHHGCQSTDFAGVGTQQELGGSLSPSGVTAHSAAATVRKVWILLPITTKRVEIPCPQHCDSFSEQKERSTAGSAGKYQNWVIQPKGGWQRDEIHHYQCTGWVWGSWGSHIPLSWHISRLQSCSKLASLLQPKSLQKLPISVSPHAQRMPHAMDETHPCYKGSSSPNPLYQAPEHLDAFRKTALLAAQLN